MIRTKRADKYPKYYQHWGGHLPFPPADCENFDRSFIDQESGIRWIDICFCTTMCRKICHRRKEYSANNNQEWKDELFRLRQYEAENRFIK